MNRTSLVIASLLLAGAASAHDLKTGDLHIIHPHISDPLPSAQSAAGYMAISNDGDEPERLMGVVTPFAEASMMHTTILGDDGVARMRPMPDLIIPAGETILMEPGGIHVMMMGLTGTADAGDMIPATLYFENAGQIQIEFMVDPANGDEMDHSQHSH